MTASKAVPQTSKGSRLDFLHTVFVGFTLIFALFAIMGWVFVAVNNITGPWANAFHTFLLLIAASIAAFRQGYTDTNSQGFSSRDIPLFFTILGSSIWLVALISPILTSPWFAIVPLCITIGAIADWGVFYFSEKRIIGCHPECCVAV